MSVPRIECQYDRIMRFAFHKLVAVSSEPQSGYLYPVVQRKSRYCLAHGEHKVPSSVRERVRMYDVDA